MTTETQFSNLDTKVSNLDTDVRDLSKSIIASNRWTLGLLGGMILAMTGFLESQIWDLNKSISALTVEVKSVQVQIQSQSNPTRSHK
jgi:hypothetical protein